jgi:DNA-binding NtrC family response regulator
MDDTLGPTLSRPARAAVRAQQSDARLHIVYPPHARGCIELASEPCTLGRRAVGPSPGIRDATVSRAHCRIDWDPVRGEHVVRDLDSRNGTRLSGHALDQTPRALHHNAVLRIGDVFTVYERWPRSLADAPAVDRDQIFGESLAQWRLRAAIARAAVDPAPVLVVGPTGTGKEYVARELHRLSGRRGALVPFNCAALSPQLAESQLFGHVRGAFTGADRAAPGLFRSAARGTVFLDEIGEMPLDLQPKLLRVLEAHEVQPVGQSRPEPVDTRILAATHRALQSRIEAGDFRRDLYGRLALWEIAVPALSERRADLMAWCDRMFVDWCAARGQTERPLMITADAVERLLLADWPENLRGLHRFIHRVAHLEVVDVDDLDLPAPAAPAPSSARPAKPTAEQLRAALAEHDGSVRAVAKAFGRDRRQIYRWMDAYGLRDE